MVIRFACIGGHPASSERYHWLMALDKQTAMIKGSKFANTTSYTCAGGSPEAVKLHRLAGYIPCDGATLATPSQPSKKERNAPRQQEVNMNMQI
jgi:hypothetical protein